MNTEFEVAITFIGALSFIAGVATGIILHAVAESGFSIKKNTNKRDLF